MTRKALWFSACLFCAGYAFAAFAGDTVPGPNLGAQTYRHMMIDMMDADAATRFQMQGEIDQGKAALGKLQSDFDAYKKAHPETPAEPVKP